MPTKIKNYEEDSRNDILVILFPWNLSKVALIDWSLLVSCIHLYIFDETLLPWGLLY